MLNKCNKCSSPYQTKYSYTLSSYESNSSTSQRCVSIVLLDDQILELNVDVINFFFFVVDVILLSCLILIFYFKVKMFN